MNYLDILLKLNNQLNVHHRSANCTSDTRKHRYNHAPGMFKVLRKEKDSFKNYRSTVKESNTVYIQYTVMPHNILVKD